MGISKNKNCWIQTGFYPNSIGSAETDPSKPNENNKPKENKMWKVMLMFDEKGGPDFHVTKATEREIGKTQSYQIL